MNSALNSSRPALGPWASRLVTAAAAASVAAAFLHRPPEASPVVTASRPGGEVEHHVRTPHGTARSGWHAPGDKNCLYCREDP